MCDFAGGLMRGRGERIGVGTFIASWAAVDGTNDRMT